MNDRQVQVRWNRQTDDVERREAAEEDEAAQQAGHDVVAMRGDGGNGLAGQRALDQLEARERAAEHGVGSKGAGHAAGSRPAQSARDRDAL
jgi:hypothetical protein